MGEYADLPGVRTWYETEGTGDPLVLLHGGFCTNDTWGAQRADLAAAHRVYLPERRAHGHTADVAGPLTYQDMADDTVAFLEEVVGGPAHLVGWSDGGVVALIVMRRPARPRPQGRGDRGQLPSGPRVFRRAVDARRDDAVRARSRVLPGAVRACLTGRRGPLAGGGREGDRHVAYAMALTAEDLARVGASTLVMVATTT